MKCKDIKIDILKETFMEEFSYELDITTSFLGMGLDGLDTISLLMALERKLDTHFSDEDWGGFEASENFLFLLQETRNNKLHELGIF